MNLLDERLTQIARLVRPNSRVADVGTDHGKLMVALVEGGSCPGGVACDINPMPLEKARKVIEAHGLSEQIQCVLSDGLAGVRADQVDDVVIAGMGGDLITRIVEGVPWLKSGEKHLVLQPMTKADHLREYLYSHGFYLQREVAVASGPFVYTVFSVVWDGVIRPLDEFTRRVGKVPEGDSPDTGAYLSRIRANLSERIAGLEQSTRERVELAEYHRLVAQIDALLVQREEQ